MPNYDTVKCCEETPLSSIARFYWKMPSKKSVTPPPTLSQQKYEYLFIWEVNSSIVIYMDRTQTGPSKVIKGPFQVMGMNGYEEPLAINVYGHLSPITNFSTPFYVFMRPNIAVYAFEKKWWIDNNIGFPIHWDDIETKRWQMLDEWFAKGVRERNFWLGQRQWFRGWMSDIDFEREGHQELIEFYESVNPSNPPWGNVYGTWMGVSHHNDPYAMVEGNNLWSGTDYINQDHPYYPAGWYGVPDQNWSGWPFGFGITSCCFNFGTATYLQEHCLLNLPNSIDSALVTDTLYPFSSSTVELTNRMKQIFPMVTSMGGPNPAEDGKYSYSDQWNILVWPKSINLIEKIRDLNTGQILYDSQGISKQIGQTTSEPWQYVDFELANMNIPALEQIVDMINNIPDWVNKILPILGGIKEVVSLMDYLTPKECLAVEKVVEKGIYKLKVYKVIVMETLQKILDKIAEETGVTITISDMVVDLINSVSLPWSAKLDPATGFVTQIYQQVYEVSSPIAYPEYKIECCPDGNCPPPDQCPPDSCIIQCNGWTCCYDNYGTLVKSFKTTPI